MTAAETTVLRCAAWAREVGLDPIGSAGSYEGFLLIEWPLPWPRDLSEVPDLAPVHAALEGTGLRLQGLVPVFGDEEARRVIRYTRIPGDGFAGFQRDEVIVPVDQVEEAAVALAAGGRGAPDWARPRVSDDVLLCTHGRRDTCCGSRGTALHQELSADPARFGGTIRLWRTSHTGGHRFAPTAIVLPQGTVWAFMDARALRRIVARQGPLADLLPRYRGCAGIGPAPVQALEREAFAEIGWGWLDWRRSGLILADGRVRLTGEAADGTRRTWEAVVEVARMAPVPDCGSPIEHATKAEPEFTVRDVRTT